MTALVSLQLGSWLASLKPPVGWLSVKNILVDTLYCQQASVRPLFIQTMESLHSFPSKSVAFSFLSQVHELPLT